jgi:hypothetical protein
MPTWIRVRDPKTGHEFDINEQSLGVSAGLEVLEGYPPNSGPGAHPRPAKHYVGKDGQPTKPGPRTTEELRGETPAEAEAEAEPEAGTEQHITDPQPPASPAEPIEE